jgi:short-subunit dehydrogenase
VDLADLDRCTGWIDAAERAHGSIDVLVLNAGSLRIGWALSTTDADAETLMRVNLFAAQRITRRVVPSMIARGSGIIAVICSLTAIVPAPGLADYSASKAALASWFEALRLELRDTGVRVVTVYPGPIGTDMAVSGWQKLTHLALSDRMPTATPRAFGERVRQAVDAGEERVFYPSVYRAWRAWPNAMQWMMSRFAPRPREEPTWRKR